MTHLYHMCIPKCTLQIFYPFFKKKDHILIEPIQKKTTEIAK